MIKRSTWLPIGVAGALVASVAASTVALGLPKDDPAEIRAKALEKREEIRAKYTEEKGGHTFHDLRYWVDVAKLEDGRWSQEKNSNTDPTRGMQLRAKWALQSTAAGGLGIEVWVIKLRHYDMKGSTRQPYSYGFDAYGEQVGTDELENLIVGFYEDWKRAAKDVREDDLEKPKKKKFGVSKWQASVTATNPDTEAPERREWYGWIDSKEIATYIVQVRYGEAVYSKEGLLEKGQDYVKNLKELSKGDSKKVEWPE